MKIKQMNIMITGATGGIGQAFARELYARGANLLLIGRDATALSELQCSLYQQQGQGGRACYFKADLTMQDDCERLLEFVNELPFSINVLINNAGTNQFAMLSSMDEEQIKSVIDTNTLAPMLLTRAMLPILMDNPQAQIVNVGSTFGSIGYPGYSAYCASKYALRGFSEALQRELADSSVWVKYLSPRATRTALNDRYVEQMNDELNSTMDEPEVVASHLVNLLENPQHSLFIGWPEKIFARLNQIFPSLVGSAIVKQLPVIRHYAALASQAGKQASAI